MPRSSSYTFVVTSVLAGCNSGPPHVRPGMPRHYKINAPLYHVGHDLIQPGLDIMFSPPYGFRAFYGAHGVGWAPAHSKGKPHVYIDVSVGLSLDSLNDPCGPPPDSRKTMEVQRHQRTDGVNALCNNVNVDYGYRVIQLRRNVNWVVGCEMSTKWNGERVISEEDALTLCDTLQLIGISDYTEADEKLALRNYGDGPSAEDDP